MKNQKLIYLVALLVALLSNSLYSQMPRTMAYQGVLTDGAGNLFPDGNRAIKVTLYDNISGGNSVYSETQNVPVVKGVFNMIIGTSTPIPTSLSFNRAYFMGVSVNGAAELSPRTPFSAAPYAFHAAVADEAKSLSPGATGVVTSVNGLQGAVTLNGGGGTTVTQSGGVITISSSGGSGGTGIQGVQSPDGSISISNPNGPTANLSIANNSINSSKIQDGSITAADIAPGVIPSTSGFMATGTAAGGDLVGTYPNPSIAINSINSSKIADGSITAADIASGVIPTVPSSLPPNGSAGGDLAGAYPNPSVAKLQGRTVANTAPTTGQVLKWDGSQWLPSADATGSFSLPYSNVVNNGGSASFSIENTGSGTNTMAIRGASPTGFGVYGASPSGTGVYGTSSSGTGVYATSSSGNGVYSLSMSGNGVSAVSGTGSALDARSSSGTGVYARSTTGIGLYSYSSSGIGLHAEASGSSPALRASMVDGGNALEIANGYIKIGSGIQKTAFVHTVSGGGSHQSILNYPNMASNDIVFVTHSQPNLSGSPLPRVPYSVWWNGSAWVIYLDRGTGTETIPSGARFNVLVIKQ